MSGAAWLGVAEYVAARLKDTKDQSELVRQSGLQSGHPLVTFVNAMNGIRMC